MRGAARLVPLHFVLAIASQLRQYEFYYVPVSMLIYLTLASMLRIRRAELRGDPAPIYLILLQSIVVRSPSTCISIDPASMLSVEY